MARAEQQKESTEPEESAISIRNKHQRKLMKELQARKLQEETGEVVPEKKAVEVGDIAAFPSPAHYPADLRRDQIYTDTDHEVLFVPIHGVPVPFSVHTIKTVIMSEEGGYGYFRVNFHTPQTKSAKDVSATMQRALASFPGATSIFGIP